MLLLTKLVKHDSIQLQIQSHPYWQIPHITACTPPTPSSLTIAISLKHVLSPCVYVSFSDTQYVYLAIIVKKTSTVYVQIFEVRNFHC